MTKSTRNELKFDFVITRTLIAPHIDFGVNWNINSFESFLDQLSQLDQVKITPTLFNLKSKLGKKIR